MSIAHDSLILTPKGQVPIQNLRARDTVINRNGPKKVTMFSRVKINPEVMEIELQSGLKLLCTEDQLIQIDINYVFIEFIPAKEITEGTSVITTTKNIKFIDRVVNYLFGCTTEATYDLELEDGDHYLANDFVVGCRNTKLENLYD